MQDCYELGTGCYSVYGFEYIPGWALPQLSCFITDDVFPFVAGLTMRISLGSTMGRKYGHCRLPVWLPTHKQRCAYSFSRVHHNIIRLILPHLLDRSTGGIPRAHGLFIHPSTFPDTDLTMWRPSHIVHNRESGLFWELWYYRLPAFGAPSNDVDRLYTCIPAQGRTQYWLWSPGLPNRCLYRHVGVFVFKW